MKRIIVVLILGFVFVACGEQTEPLKPLDKGMSNAVTLSNGEVVYKIDGAWNSTIEEIDHLYPYNSTVIKDIIKITQEGNNFVGNFLNGNEYQGAGIEIIKGELEKNGFKSLYVNTSTKGWLPATSKISENCNKFVAKTPIKKNELTLNITLTRK